jgi:hypothetical protein
VRSNLPGLLRPKLSQFVEGLLGFSLLLALGVKLEIGFELGDGFVLLLQLLGNLCKGEVGGGVVGLDFDGVLGTKVGTLKVAITHIKFGDAKILVDTLIVGLHLLDFGELAMGGGAFGALVLEGRPDVGRSVGIAAAGATGATGTAAGAVAGKLGGRGGGEWVVGGGGVLGRGRARSTGRVGGGRGLTGEWELLGDGRLACACGGWGAGLGGRGGSRLVLILICGWAGSLGRSLLRARLGEGRGRECDDGQQCAGFGEECHRVLSTPLML